MSETKDFDVVRVARSDGSDSGPGYWPIAPAAAAVKKAATDKAPRAKPQMTRLTEDDPRYTEWRVKLGILLKQELSPTPDEGNSWYVPFPRGYWLYEKSKHLWVSGYPIKPKLFKTPQEFALHLIWLLSPSRSYKDCCCIHCNPQIPPRIASIADDDYPRDSPVKASSYKGSSRATPVPLPHIHSQASPKAAPPPARSQTIPKQIILAASPPANAVPNQVAAIKQSPVPIPAAPATQLRPQQPNQAQQLQQTAPQAQAIQWTLKSSIAFRVGELVWYQHGSSRLGVIASANQVDYTLLPIGHGSFNQPHVNKKAEEIRPFQAFSVPQVNTKSLVDKIFDQVPWEAEIQTARGDAHMLNALAVDASKMAASKIDFSNSLWSTISQDAASKTSTYYGCFLGAERVEVGDCLRLKPLQKELGFWTETAVLGLRYIFTTQDYPNLVFFRGHVYRPVKQETAGASAVPSDQLPTALRDEINWRNSLPGQHRWRWIMVKDSIVLQEKHIKGRFYPTPRLIHIMRPADLESITASGAAAEQLIQLNDRMNGKGQYLGRRRNRWETLGATVSHSAQLAFEPHVREDAVTTV